MAGFLVLGAGAAFASKVDPVLEEGTPTCGQYDPDNPKEWVELKIPASDFHNGDYSDDLITVTISNWNASTATFDWSTTFDVEVVIVKGGPNANSYIYDPDQKSDTGLHTPASSSGGNYELTHVSVCYEPEDNPSPSPSPSVSPTETETTTPETTPPQTSGPEGANSPEATVLGRTLSESGAAVGGIALAGVAMIVLGSVAYGVTLRVSKPR